MLNSLEVEQFRNLTAARLEFVDGFNLIVGPNGAGKTTVLEAIHLLARGKSFRSSRSSNLVQKGQPLLRARADVQAIDGIRHALGVEKPVSGLRRLRLDGEESKSAASIASHLPIQLLLPNVGDLVFSGPAARREFMDWGLFHVKQNYVEIARRYRKLLKQRNAWLRHSDLSRAQDDPWLDLITETGHIVNELRESYLKDFSHYFSSVIERLDPQLACHFEYSTGGYEKNLPDTRKKMTEALQREVKSGGTQIGPHRADLIIRLAEASASETASRGQGKAIASAAALAQAALMKDRFQRASLVLIDDIGAEFDSNHRSNLLQALAAIGSQVVATATDMLPEALEAFEEDRIKVFHVEQGTVNVLQFD
ncbi:MAG: DNA replication/repair protein RecF [Pseudomonadales bacterium]